MSPLGAGPETIERFSFRERVVHWATAIAFVYGALTGLSLWSPHLYWLAAVFGGGVAVRWGHPWGGLIFVVALGAMFASWRRQMRLDAEDRVWLRNARRYLTHDEAGLPEAGRFNAGQKMLFWFQATAALVLLLSGIVLWFPESMPRALRLAAVLVHPVAAVGAIAFILVHVYMATAAVPEALRAMTRGWVRPVWASSHHPKWYREISKR